VRTTIRDELANACEVAEALGGKSELKLRDGYPPVVNDGAMTALSIQAIGQSIGLDSIVRFDPMMGAEDFALMLQHAPGTFIWLGGALKRPREHHHPEFDVDERVLVKGAAALAAIGMTALGALTGPAFHVP
jgi:metal-dependent amidase/aminoacylase/carboxypeptidase family protein